MAPKRASPYHTNAGDDIKRPCPDNLTVPLYSIIAEEWPEVKARLLDRAQSFRKPTPQRRL
jgi:hypothetical protein